MYIHAKAIPILILFLMMSAAPETGFTIKGNAIDSSGRPVTDATVMVYHAGVLSGYSTFCPSCYRDCGKRTKTDASGSYTISNLASGLWFDLLFVRDGYSPEIVRVKDPSSGTAPVATLKARASVTDPTHMVKGHVVDSSGRAVPDAVVTTIGVEDENGSMVGTIPGLDPLVVTDQGGNFEIDYEKPATRMLVTVESRTLPLKFATLFTGPQSQKIELGEGATVRGRVVQDGKPVADAEVGLIGQKRGGYGPALSIVGDPYPEMRIGTQQDGTFAISNVPTGVQWFIYPKMESVAARGAAAPKVVLTARPNVVDVCEFSLRPGYRLRGRVVLSDGKAVPDGTHISITSKRSGDAQTTVADAKGRFEFVGLPPGGYSISPSVKDYELADKQYVLRASIQHDIDDYVVSLSPAASKR
jgi:protocatechuate 3,4-dioxygenase beta subunit